MGGCLKVVGGCLKVRMQLVLFLATQQAPPAGLHRQCATSGVVLHTSCRGTSGCGYSWCKPAFPAHFGRRHATGCNIVHSRHVRGGVAVLGCAVLQTTSGVLWRVL